MKRRETRAQDQPVAKKSDPKKPDVSSDLRSKISAKLQTLLNGINSESDLYIQHKRQLYADLFREPQYSEIIIDPTIVVKIEDSDSDESSDTVSYLSSESFLTSAKSRITELLNKQQDCEKENSKECVQSPSHKSKTSSPSSSKGKSRNLNSSDCCNQSHTDVLINQGQLQNLSVTVENVASKGRTKASRSQPKSGQVITLNPKILVKDSDKSAKCSHISDSHEISSSPVLHSSLVEINNDKNSSSIKSRMRVRNCRKNLSAGDSCHASDSTYSSSMNKDNINVSVHTVYNVDEESIDDPEVCLTVEENAELVMNYTGSEIVPSDNQDDEVILLCEKRPTYDVITLEEDEHSGDLVEEVQKCNQCGKTFRAKSLLNFHLRMHGSDITQMSSSVSN